MGSCRKAVWWHVLLRPHGRPLAAILTSGRCPCSSHAVQLRAALAHTEAASPGESGRLCRSPSAQLFATHRGTFGVSLTDIQPNSPRR